MFVEFGGMLGGVCKRLRDVGVLEGISKRTDGRGG